jgi:predicted glycosyltransferase
MRVIFDIAHYPHMNLFKNAIFSLLDDGIEVMILVEPRGNLTTILEYEYGLPYKSFGHHRSTLLGKMLNLAVRDLEVFNYLRKNPCDVMLGAGSVNLSHASYVLRKPSVMFEDDLEYKLGYYPYSFFATHIVMPKHLQASGKNILTYRGYKELAYLHPNYFAPSESILKEYNLTKNNYVFIREVSKTTMNYSHLEEGLLSDICPYLKEMGFDIILSLENKKLRNKYENTCIILEEPVKDIHSLLHYAAMTIASGDSMSRESCLVGTPAIYTGGRDMLINKELIDRGCFFKIDHNSHIMQYVKEIIEHDLKKEASAKIKKAIRNEWSDTTQVISDIIFSKLYNDPSLIDKYRSAPE